MNLSVWTQMQSISCLETIDLMLPDLVSDKDFEEVRRNKLRKRRGYASANPDMTRSLKRLIGGLLVAWALAMLAPGPVDVWFAKKGAEVGMILGSPWGPMGMLIGGAIGAVVFVVAYNLFAMAVFALGTWMIVTG